MKILDIILWIVLIIALTIGAVIEQYQICYMSLMTMQLLILIKIYGRKGEE